LIRAAAIAGVGFAIAGLGILLVLQEPAAPIAPAATDVQAHRDCVECPEMVVVPGGSFVMGAERWHDRHTLTFDAIPRREVTIAKAFAVGRYEVSFAEWDACVADGGCGGPRPDDLGWGRENMPVLNVSWQDAQQYVSWLSQETGGRYRLLTEAEWEYAARAGSHAPYPWGDDASHVYANYGHEVCCVGRAHLNDQWVNTSPQGKFPPNAFGLHDMHGNAYEWVQDCYSVGYSGKPVDGGAWSDPACDRHVIRGAAYYSDPGRIRSAYRAWQKPDRRDKVIGLRVAKSL
jgi:formylglycine-generating enzyme required for sulfatase activity